MELYLAEKKVLAEAIASALPGKGSIKDGVIYKDNGNAVTWLSGHLLTLREPEKYDPRYKEWKLDDLPIYFESWENDVPAENRSRVNQLSALIKEASLIINCGDTDEEGQLLVDELLRYCHYNGPCKRLDTANTTVDALKKALGRMKDNKDCVNDGWSAYARQVSDMTFGINLTRFFSKKYNSKLPVGRVQTPTLGLVVNRDMAIEQHKKVYYYTLSANTGFTDISVSLPFYPDKDLPELTDGKFLSPDGFLNNLSTDLRGKSLNFTVKKEKLSEPAPLPFNLTTLNSYCGKKWGYKPDRIMKITQSLRDNYSAITYNRSDCQYLSSEHFKEAPETVGAVCRNFGMKNDFDFSIKSRCFNDANITAHFAIIPTNANFDVNKLSPDEFRVYDAICRFYLIQFVKPCIKEKTSVSSSVVHDGKPVGLLKGVSSKILFMGWRSLLMDKSSESDKNAYDDKDNDDISGLDILPEGISSGRIDSCNIEKKETKPPKRYTQTSLYEDMTKISKYVDDPDIRRMLLEKDKEKKGENGSIGTSATRAEIIKKLIQFGYLEERKEGKKDILISTEKGRRFYSILPDRIKKADTTAVWWVVQEDIKNGRSDYTALTNSVLSTIKDVMDGFEIRNEDLSAFSNGSAKPLCTCPSCGGDILKGKYGPYCKNKCGFRLSKVFGKTVTESQFISLCNGRKTKISGIPKKSGDGTFDAFAVPSGVEDFSYDSGGKHYEGKQLKIEMVFK